MLKVYYHKKYKNCNCRKKKKKRKRKKERNMMNQKEDISKDYFLELETKNQEMNFMHGIQYLWH